MCGPTDSIDKGMAALLWIEASKPLKSVNLKKKIICLPLVINIKLLLSWCVEASIM